MKLLFAMLVMLLAVSSCNMLKKKSTDEKRTRQEDKQKDNKDPENKDKRDDISLKFNQPVQIDSTAYVMYPLMLTDNDGKDRGIVSKSYSGQNVFWNIVFYNTQTGEYHLLDSTRKMAIYSYAQGNAKNNFSSNQTDQILLTDNQTGNLIYYWMTTIDFNSDERIDLNDPKYLFVSSKDGKNLKQISPDDYNVVYWQTIYSTDKVLMQAVKDLNNNKKFDEDDESVPFIYDIRTGEAPKEIFSSDFKSMTEKLLEKQWDEE